MGCQNFLGLINSAWRKDEAKIMEDIIYGKHCKENTKPQFENNQHVLPLNLA
jgi:hypothetical protein